MFLHQVRLLTLPDLQEVSSQPLGGDTQVKLDVMFAEVAHDFFAVSGPYLVYVGDFPLRPSTSVELRVGHTWPPQQASMPAGEEGSQCDITNVMSPHAAAIYYSTNGVNFNADYDPSLCVTGSEFPFHPGSICDHGYNC